MFKPLSDRVLIRPLDADKMTGGGLHLPDNAQEKSTKGEVISVGPGRVTDDGNVVKPTVDVGQKVLYEQYAATNVKFSNEEYVVVRCNEIIGVID